MWIRTNFDVLLNTDTFRSIFVEDRGKQERRWGVIGLEPKTTQKDEERIIFGAYETKEQAEYARNRIYQALHEGRNVFDMPRGGKR